MIASVALAIVKIHKYLHQIRPECFAWLFEDAQT